MEVNGLPLHPLAVHGAVVLAPLAALLALCYLVPRWRDRLRWPLVVGALVAAVAVVVAYLSGDSFREANDFFTTPESEITAQIDDHEQLGTVLMWVTLGFAATALLAVLLHRRTESWLRVLLGGVLVLASVAVIGLVVLTGDSGATAVWDGFAG